MKMNNFEKFKQMPIGEFAEWLDKYGDFDGSPWIKWFDETYCANCEDIITFPVIDYTNVGTPRSYCEINKKCRFFPDMKEPPDTLEIIKMWLMSDDNERL